MAALSAKADSHLHAEQDKATSMQWERAIQQLHKSRAHYFAGMPLLSIHTAPPLFLGCLWQSAPSPLPYEGAVHLSLWNIEFSSNLNVCVLDGWFLFRELSQASTSCMFTSTHQRLSSIQCVMFTPNADSYMHDSAIDWASQ